MCHCISYFRPFPYSLFLDKNKHNSQQKTTTFKDFSDTAIDQFKLTLLAHNWNLILTNDDPEKSYELFYNDFIKLYNDNFPLKTVRFNKNFHNIEPWITKGLLTSHVPSKLKIAKVIPVYKSGDTQDMNNYRPISLLSNFAKILEKIVFNRLHTFLIDNNIISPNQFGFRKKHSTVHPMTVLHNSIGKSMQEKNILSLFSVTSKKRLTPVI